MKLFRRAPVEPRGHQAGFPLVVGVQDLRVIPEDPVVQEGLGSDRGIRDEAHVPPVLLDLPVPAFTELEGLLFVPLPVEANRLVRGIGDGRNLASAEFEEALPAGSAVTDAGARPAVAEDAVQVVSRRELAVHPLHEIEAVGPERAADVGFGIRPVAPGLPVGGDGGPFRMRPEGVLVDRVGIGPAEDRVSLFPAGFHHVSEEIRVLFVLHAVVIRDLRLVIGDVSAGPEDEPVDFAVVQEGEPAVGVEFPDVPFADRQLGVPHGGLQILLHAVLRFCFHGCFRFSVHHSSGSLSPKASHLPSGSSMTNSLFR